MQWDLSPNHMGATSGKWFPCELGMSFPSWGLGDPWVFWLLPATGQLVDRGRGGGLALIVIC